MRIFIISNERVFLFLIRAARLLSGLNLFHNYIIEIIFQTSVREFATTMRASKLEQTYTSTFKKSYKLQSVRPWVPSRGTSTLVHAGPPRRPGTTGGGGAGANKRPESGFFADVDPKGTHPQPPCITISLQINHFFEIHLLTVPFDLPLFCSRSVPSAQQLATRPYKTWWSLAKRFCVESELERCVGL